MIKYPVAIVESEKEADKAMAVLRDLKASHVFGGLFGIGWTLDSTRSLYIIHVSSPCGYDTNRVHDFLNNAEVALDCSSPLLNEPCHFCRHVGACDADARVCGYWLLTPNEQECKEMMR